MTYSPAKLKTISSPTTSPNSYSFPSMLLLKATNSTSASCLRMLLTLICFVVAGHCKSWGNPRVSIQQSCCQRTTYNANLIRREIMNNAIEDVDKKVKRAHYETNIQYFKAYLDELRTGIPSDADCEQNWQLEVNMLNLMMFGKEMR
ncbi:hypothetical protein EV361DRAFT_873501 [Lentinula raphanica]|uniref:Uncharacterized protein n=1 Tax=Lentinula raphanica TaxID=153919 RepID=A0AA38P0I3_9AGAR|nr:hypothetical protein F5880DRAFT_1505281 [Lentinula raphanica]KAJ3834052.1 hypothetical protein F5878DRAFT_645439 [Lentinula raphanica]KAJ3965061.1 hypothetical protein EV361DRAFT_873501 [Lentinula raphanica]